MWLIWILHIEGKKEVSDQTTTSQGDIMSINFSYLVKAIQDQTPTAENVSEKWSHLLWHHKTFTQQ